MNIKHKIFIFTMFATCSITALGVDIENNNSDPLSVGPLLKLQERSKQSEHCGIASLYVILRLFGEDVAINNIISEASPEVFLEGMNVGEFKRMLDEYKIKHIDIFGESATVQKYLNNNYYVIVPNDARRHLLVYLGQKDNQYLRFDPSHRVSWVGKKELDTDWHGYGIVVSNQPIAVSQTPVLKLMSQSFLKILLTISIILFIVGLCLRIHVKKKNYLTAVPILMLIVAVPTAIFITTHKGHRLVYNRGTRVNKFLKLDSEALDLGHIREGNSGTGKIRIQNISKQTVVIKSLDADCGCVLPTLKKREVKPRESIELDISLETRGINGKTIKYVSVVGEDKLGNKQRLIIPIKANVLSKLNINPSLINFREIKTGQTYKASIFITSQLFPDFEIENIEIQANYDENPKPKLEVLWHKNKKNGYKLDCILKPDPDLPSQGSVYCKIDFNKQELSDLGVWVLWSKKEDFLVYPQVIVGYSQKQFVGYIRIEKKANSETLVPVRLNVDFEGADLLLLEDKPDSLTYKLSIDAKRMPGIVQKGKVDIYVKGEKLPAKQIPIMLICD